MGLFGLFKKSHEQKQATQILTDTPYSDNSTNLIYNLLFCDDLELYKASVQPPYTYPFNILFSDTSSSDDLQRIGDDTNGDSRARILACNRQLANGHKPERKELLAVIVEVGLDEGLDVLASFGNGTARYINHTGRVLIWETTTNNRANELTADLFSKSRQIVNQIGPWDKPRKVHPARGNTRISFLVSDGLYFGEAPTDVLFNDPLASSALASATSLMQYLTAKSLEKNSSH